MSEEVANITFYPISTWILINSLCLLPLCTAELLKLLRVKCKVLFFLLIPKYIFIQCQVAACIGAGCRASSPVRRAESRRRLQFVSRVRCSQSSAERPPRPSRPQHSPPPACSVETQTWGTDCGRSALSAVMVTTLSTQSTELNGRTVMSENISCSPVLSATFLLNPKVM